MKWRLGSFWQGLLGYLQMRFNSRPKRVKLSGLNDLSYQKAWKGEIISEGTFLDHLILCEVWTSREESPNLLSALVPKLNFLLST